MRDYIFVVVCMLILIGTGIVAAEPVITENASPVAETKKNTVVRGKVDNIHRRKDERPANPNYLKSYGSTGGMIRIKILDPPSDFLPLPYIHGGIRSLDSDGYFEHEFSPGKYELTLWDRTPAPPEAVNDVTVPSNTRIITVDGQESIFVELHYFTPPPAEKTIMRVIDGTTNKALANTKLFGAHEKSFQTNDQGEVTFDHGDDAFGFLPADMARVKFRTADGQRVGFLHYDESLSETSVTLHPPAALSGRLLDAKTKKPLANLIVRANFLLESPEMPPHRLIIQCERTETDDEGRFQFKNLLHNRKYDITVNDAEDSSDSRKTIAHNVFPAFRCPEFGDIFIDYDDKVHYPYSRNYLEEWFHFPENKSELQENFDGWLRNAKGANKPLFVVFADPLRDRERLEPFFCRFETSEELEKSLEKVFGPVEYLGKATFSPAYQGDLMQDVQELVRLYDKEFSQQNEPFIMLVSPNGTHLKTVTFDRISTD